MLFPWARAIVYAHLNHYKVISPTWPQIKIGTILRKERDKRTYHKIFKNNDNFISGNKRIFCLLINKRIKENNCLSAKNGDIIEFYGMQGLFKEILHNHKIVYENLLLSISEENKSGLNFNFDNSVSIHIRLGDFKESNLQLESGSNNVRIPISWYISILKIVRCKYGEDIKAYIFSDGSDEELKDILSIKGCMRLNFGTAMADLLALSRSELLIASGSTFSMWASYLGRMPVIWYPGQLKQKLYFNNEALEVECDGQSNYL